MDAVTHYLAIEDWKRVDNRYWLGRAVMLVISAVAAASILGDGRGPVLWLLYVTGLVTFPIASYWSAGSAKLFYRTTGVSDLKRASRSGSGLGEKATSYLFIKVVRYSLRVLGGVVSILCWPLTLPLSVALFKAHVAQFDREVAASETAADEQFA